jgi:hypothetical protein
MTKRFTRRKEDFVCENCGEHVKSGGYTNHCPNCLYSKHVDINPGDRMSECRGMMRPAYLEKVSDGFAITFVCEGAPIFICKTIFFEAKQYFQEIYLLIF